MGVAIAPHGQQRSGHFGWELRLATAAEMHFPVEIAAELLFDFAAGCLEADIREKQNGGCL